MLADAMAKKVKYSEPLLVFERRPFEQTILANWLLKGVRTALHTDIELQKYFMHNVLLEPEILIPQYVAHTGPNPNLGSFDLTMNRVIVNRKALWDSFLGSRAGRRARVSLPLWHPDAIFVHSSGHSSRMPNYVFRAIWFTNEVVRSGFCARRDPNEFSDVPEAYADDPQAFDFKKLHDAGMIYHHFDVRPSQNGHWSVVESELRSHGLPNMSFVWRPTVVTTQFKFVVPADGSATVQCIGSSSGTAMRIAAVDRFVAQRRERCTGLRTVPAAPAASGSGDAHRASGGEAHSGARADDDE